MGTTRKDKKSDKSATILFPHQLFIHHPGLEKTANVIMVEEQLFFGDPRYNQNFHKKKLVMHRASMQAFRDYLVRKKYHVHYCDYTPDVHMKKLFDMIKEKHYNPLYIADPADYMLKKRLTREANARNTTIEFLDSPGFLNNESGLKDYFKTKKHFSQTSFYIAQRKRLQILVEDKKPVGGKWSFEPENRKKIPRDLSIPEPWFPANDNKYVREAQRYVEQHFPDNPGNARGFFYPITHQDAVTCFRDFLENRLEHFGDYEDAILKDSSFLFHSILSLSLNTGLLTPEFVVKETLTFAEKNSIRLNSLEGFIRQIIGWREFMRAIYMLKGVNERTANFWRHTRKMPNAFYTASTGVDPVDTVIRRVIDKCYAHHIERLWCWEILCCYAK